MKRDGYYSSGEFAKLANVTIRTVRYYDKQNVLKPSLVTDSGIRLYTDEDFVNLQQILLLKYLGFSLEEIKEIRINDLGFGILRNQLELQSILVDEKIEQMQLVRKAINDTIFQIDQNKQVNWEKMMELIRLTSVENTLKIQYQNSNNINARMRLHKSYSKNTKGWFPWMYEQIPITDGKRVLEVGCGNGALWIENIERLPQEIEIVLSDSSSGITKELKRGLHKIPTSNGHNPFTVRTFPIEKIPYEDASFDIVIANHMLFYCDDLEKAISEVQRVLKRGGTFVCSTYSANHMKEINNIVQEFDSRITLSGENLYEKFGLENGRQFLNCFATIDVRMYEDELIVDQPDPIVEYVLSCHGNQNQFLIERYKEFRGFVEKRTEKNFHITKEAGIFVCNKSK